MVQSPPTTPPAPSSGDGRRLRQRILDVALTLFAQRGYSATSMREVALGAACTKPALYYHFENKAGLFLEVINEQMRTIGGVMESQFARPGSVRERCHAAMVMHFEHIRQNPLGLRMLVRAELHAESGQPTFDFRSFRDRFRDMLAALLREGVDNGELRADLNIDDAVEALAGMVDFRCMLLVLQGEPIPEDYPARVLKVLYGGFAL